MSLNGLLSSSIDLKNITLRSIFSGQLDYLKIAHFNPGSLIRHIDEFREVLRNVPLDIIAISETWFNDKKHNNMIVAISGYNLVRNDRTNKRGGGVAIYVRDNIKFRVIKKSKSDATVEYTFIEILNNRLEKLVVGVVYNPPKNSCIAGLNNILTDLSKSTLPTNFVNNSATQIDLILAKYPSKINIFTQLSLPGISTHDLILSSYDFKLNVPKIPTFKSIRKINKINLDNLQYFSNSLNWSIIYELNNVNDQLEILNNNLISLLNTFAPLEEVVVSNENIIDTYGNPQIQALRNIRDFKHECYRRNQTLENWNAFKSARNNVNKAVDKSKSYAISKKLNPNLPHKLLWNNLKKLGISNNGNLDTCPFSADELNRYFSSVYTVNINCDNFSSPQDRNFSFRNVSMDEVLFFLTDIQSNATGIDDIPPSFIKKLLPLILPYITHISTPRSLPQLSLTNGKSEK